MVAFLAHPEREVLRRERELLAGAGGRGRYVEITVHDPKPRTVFAAPFRDRVMHHTTLCAAHRAPVRARLRPETAGDARTGRCI